VDTTLWPLANGQKACLALVSDNFSRALLGWSISLNNTASNVRAALQQAIRTIREHHPNHPCATLVADGGSENHAHTIDQLLESVMHPSITKVIALKDIRFSNSPVEALNRIFKRYLRFYQPDTETALREVLTDKIIPDYNVERPHGSLRGLTPMEAYVSPERTLSFTPQRLSARALRIRENKAGGCAECWE